MNLDWKAIVLLAACRRQNPALLPRWSKAVAAIRLAFMLGPEDKGFVQGLASVALDTCGHGPTTGAMRAVAEVAALESHNPETRRIGQLMAVLFPNLGAAISAALNGNETAAMACFSDAVANAEVFPDKGEAWAAIKRLPIPGRDLETLRRDSPWLFEGDAELTAAAAEVSAAVV
jgi:hypothetical protein